MAPTGKAGAGERGEVGAVGSHLAFAELVARVEPGREIQIERDRKVVARPVPAVSKDAADAVAACRRMDELAEQATLGGLTIRGLIDEGRKH
jgi:antitoxin (DNA-binding transcriptional repressor) of toxin-antitoxin stability system